MSEERKLDLNKTLMELAAECWSGNDLLAAFKAQLNAEQQNAKQQTNGQEQQNEQEQQTKKVTREPLIQRITDTIQEIGIPARLMGYKYIRDGIELAVSDPTIIQFMTKKLYPKVAEKFGTTASRAERAIRHAIEVAWDRGDLEIMQKYFGNTVSSAKGKPTNSEFIAMIADHLRMEGYEESK